MITENRVTEQLVMDYTNALIRTDLLLTKLDSKRRFDEDDISRLDEQKKSLNLLYKEFKRFGWDNICIKIKDVIKDINDTDYDCNR